MSEITLQCREEPCFTSSGVLTQGSSAANLLGTSKSRCGQDLVPSNYDMVPLPDHYEFADNWCYVTQSNKVATQFFYLCICWSDKCNMDAVSVKDVRVFIVFICFTVIFSHRT